MEEVLLLVREVSPWGRQRQKRPHKAGVFVVGAGIVSGVSALEDPDIFYFQLRFDGLGSGFGSCH